MPDVRTSTLSLAGSEDSDWTLVFTQWGILIHDEQIGHAMRVLGWLGVLTALDWLARHIRRDVK